MSPPPPVSIPAPPPKPQDPDEENKPLEGETASDSSGNVPSLEQKTDDIKGFDLKTLISLLKDQDSSLGKGEHVVIFIGGTGAGKSTTINFLAGCEMKRRAPLSNNGSLFSSDDTEVYAVNEKQGFEIGFNTVSKTRTFNVWKAEDLDLALCDSPGFHDSKGVTYDIAMSVGLRDLMVNSASCRLCFVIDGEARGNRGEFIKLPLKVLSRMFRNIETQAESLCFMFTKVDPAQSQPFHKIMRDLEDIAKHSPESNDAEKFFAQAIINFVIKNKEADGSYKCWLNPLGSRDKYVDLLKQTKSINVSMEEVELALTDTHRAYLRGICAQKVHTLGNHLQARLYEQAYEVWEQVSVLAGALKLSDLYQRTQESQTILLAHVDGLVEGVKTNLELGRIRKASELMRDAIALEAKFKVEEVAHSCENCKSVVKRCSAKLKLGVQMYIDAMMLDVELASDTKDESPLVVHHTAISAPQVKDVLKQLNTLYLIDQYIQPVLDGASTYLDVKDILIASFAKVNELAMRRISKIKTQVLAIDRVESAGQRDDLSPIYFPSFLPQPDFELWELDRCFKYLNDAYVFCYHIDKEKAVHQHCVTYDSFISTISDLLEAVRAVIAEGLLVGGLVAPRPELQALSLVQMCSSEASFYSLSAILGSTRQINLASQLHDIIIDFVDKSLEELSLGSSNNEQNMLKVLNVLRNAICIGASSESIDKAVGARLKTPVSLVGGQIKETFAALAKAASLLQQPGDDYSQLDLRSVRNYTRTFCCMRSAQGALLPKTLDEVREFEAELSEKVEEAFGSLREELSSATFIRNATVLDKASALMALAPFSTDQQWTEFLRCFENYVSDLQEAACSPALLSSALGLSDALQKLKHSSAEASMEPKFTSQLQAMDAATDKVLAACVEKLQAEYNQLAESFDIEKELIRRLEALKWVSQMATITKVNSGNDRARFEVNFDDAEARFAEGVAADLAAASDQAKEALHRNDLPLFANRMKTLREAQSFSNFFTFVKYDLERQVKKLEMDHQNKLDHAGDEVLLALDAANFQAIVNLLDDLKNMPEQKKECISKLTKYLEDALTFKEAPPSEPPNDSLLDSPLCMESFLKECAVALRASELKNFPETDFEKIWTGKMPKLSKTAAFVDQRYLSDLCEAVWKFKDASCLCEALQGQFPLKEKLEQLDKQLLCLFERLELQMLTQLSCFSFNDAYSSYKMLCEIAAMDSKFSVPAERDVGRVEYARRFELLKPCLSKLHLHAKNHLRDVVLKRPELLFSVPDGVADKAGSDEKKTEESEGKLDMTKLLIIGERQANYMLIQCNKAHTLLFKEEKVDFPAMASSLEEIMIAYFVAFSKRLDVAIDEGLFDLALSVLTGFEVFTKLRFEHKGDPGLKERLAAAKERIGQMQMAVLTPGPEGLTSAQLECIQQFLERSKKLPRQQYERNQQRVCSCLETAVEKQVLQPLASKDSKAGSEEKLAAQAGLVLKLKMDDHVLVHTLLRSLEDSILQYLKKQFLDSLGLDEKDRGIRTAFLEKVLTCLKPSLNSEQVKSFQACFQQVKKAQDDIIKNLQFFDFVLGDSDRNLESTELERSFRDLAPFPAQLESAMGKVEHAVAVLKNTRIEELLRKSNYAGVSRALKDLDTLCEVRPLKELLGEIDGARSKIKETLKDHQKLQEQIAIENFAKQSFKAMDKAWEELEMMEKYGAEFGIHGGKTATLLNNMKTQVAAKIGKFLEDGDCTSEEGIAEFLCDTLWKYHTECSKPELQDYVRGRIQSLFSCLPKKHAKGSKLLMDLGKELDKNWGAAGKEIISAFDVFSHIADAKRNKMTRATGLNIDHALEGFKLDEKSSKALKACWEIYTEEQTKNMLEYFDGPGPVSALVKQVQEMADALRAQYIKQGWTDIASAIPVLFARVATMWRIMKYKERYLEQDKTTPDPMEIVGNVHNIQILTIFRLLGLDQARISKENATSTWLGYLKETGKRILNQIPSFELWRDSIPKHLAQIETGGGKSITLGFLSALLALLGCDVYYACYSKYLSERDRKDFTPLWQKLGIDQHIFCTTLSNMVSTVIQGDNDIKQLTKQYMQNPTGVPLAQQEKQATNRQEKRPKVLLIDEVDVFLSDDFFANTFNLKVRLNHPAYYELLKEIFHSKAVSSSSFRGSANVKAFLTAYPGSAPLLDKDLESICAHLPQLNSHAYKVIEVKGEMLIGYDEHGTTESDIAIGKFTDLAYVKEEEAKSVERATAVERTGLTIRVGNWSYAEVPNMFACILGVTGTLDCMNSFEKAIVEGEYKIQQKSIAPSLFGANNLKVGETIIEDSKQYLFQQVFMKIQKIFKDSRRPVFVFFKDEDVLDDFKNSKYAEDLKSEMDLDLAWVTADDPRKQAKFTRACDFGKVTLFPCAYGRGVDFICYDEKVNEEGGPHIIQTFFSVAESEEIQIKGRTARMGGKGSYEAVLSAEDLVADFGCSLEDVKAARKTGIAAVEAMLQAARIRMADKEAKRLKDGREEALQKHKESLEYLELMVKGEKPDVKFWLDGIDIVPPSASPKNRQGGGRSRTVCISDATSSMLSIWGAAKQYICETIKRITEFSGAGRSELMWVAYRDYSDEKIVEKSNWTFQPDELLHFIESIICEGGGDFPEAVEIGLQAATEEGDVTRVILIADAPPHEEGKGGLVDSHRKTLDTDYKEQAHILAQKRIPVYTFYLNTTPDLVRTFTEIAEITGGKAAYFRGADDLINVLCESVLDDIDPALAVKYRAKYYT